MANMCSMCGGTNRGNSGFSGQYGNDSSGQNFRQSFGGQMPAIQLCLPTLAGKPPPSTGHHAPGQQPSIIQVPRDAVTPCPNFVCEPCPPPPPTKVWLIKSSPVPQKSACLPLGNSNEGCSSPSAKVMLCLPCPPPNMVSQRVPQVQHNTRQVYSFPFAVPQKLDDGCPSKQSGGGKYLPPPEKRICSPNCIHVTDIKGKNTCTWHQNIPCVAHCFETPL